MKIFTFTIIAIISFGLISCSSDNEATNNKTETTTPKSTVVSNSSTVDFAAYDLNGNLHQSSEWIGKQPVVINFWGTWCPPCRREIPDLVKLYDEYNQKGIEIVSLAVKDTPDKVDVYKEKAGMGWVMLMGTPAIMMSMNATKGVPTTIFLDKQGNEVTRFVGMRDYNTFKQAFESLL